MISNGSAEVRRWARVPFTDANGAALPGALTITDVRGVKSVDARKRRAWVNIQHPSSSNDRTIEITIAD
ncbi:MAG TPA: hypothetical protein VJR89_34245 [Polyangiales bacterium]|nr:hypothetical protein [Polyangiales bacterium]